MPQPRFSIISKSSTCKSCLLRYSNRPHLPSQSSPSLSVRPKSENALKYQRVKDNPKPVKKYYKQELPKPDKTYLIRYSLCDAMRYIRAFEVGQKPSSAKYDLAVRFVTTRSGAVIRNQIRLPHPLRTDLRVCVICKPDSKVAATARASGAVLIGEENVFEAVRQKQINFDRCICHQDSVETLSKAGIARILGPKNLMPSVKMGTVVKDIRASLREMIGSTAYREKSGVVRLAIGQLGYGPEEMQQNLQATMRQLKRDAASVSKKSKKELYEVVLSSTKSPGFSLDGSFSSPQSVPVADLST